MNPSQQNQTDQTTNFFWLLCLVIGGAVLLWVLRPGWLVTPVFWVRIHEIDLIQMLLKFWMMLTGWMHIPEPNLQSLNHLKQFMLTTDPSTIKFSAFASANGQMGHWMRWPIAIILFAMGATIYFHKGNMQFRQIYNMKNLRKLESENWPQIIPVLSLDLVSQDPDKGPWAMAKLPLDFCKEHKLIDKEMANDKPIWVLDKKPTFRVFSLQLGQLWRGVDALPIYAKALFVIFISRAHKQPDVARHFLRQISASAQHGKLDFSGITEQLEQYKNSGIIKWLEKRHSYTLTLMMTLLEISRASGVLATAEFLWLKPLDRRLWYTLNSVGRQACVIEVAGIFSHWLAEKKMGRALKMPMVKEAVKALEEDINNTLFVDESDRWHSNVA